jgi:site-specific DNA-adenine methylase
MRYQGGKSRIAAGIVKTIQGLTTEREIWEPFCGGGAVTIALAKAGFRVYASDSHEDLILMWQAILAGDATVCADVTEEEYQQLKTAAPSARRGFVGYASSFGSKWFGGFARSDGSLRNFAAEAARKNKEILACNPLPTFRHADYTSTPDHVVAYLDPPYAGTTSYKSAGKFNHDAFWSWVSRRQGATFISELTCPLDLPVVWRKQHKSQNASNSPTSKGAAIIEREEKLFYKAPVDTAQ